MRSENRLLIAFFAWILEADLNTYPEFDNEFASITKLFELSSVVTALKFFSNPRMESFWNAKGLMY